MHLVAQLQLAHRAFCCSVRQVCRNSSCETPTPALWDMSVPVKEGKTSSRSRPYLKFAGIFSLQRLRWAHSTCCDGRRHRHAKGTELVIIKKKDVPWSSPSATSKIVFFFFLGGDWLLNGRHQRGRCAVEYI